MTTPPEKEVPRPAIVKFRASTALAVPAPQIFPSDAGIVTVTNWTERDGAGDRHRGLLVEVALDAADPDDAVRRGLSPASFTLSLLSFASSAAAGSLRPFIAYVERTEHGCNVAQFAQRPIEPRARRMVKKEGMQALVARVNGLAPPERGRIFRALDWYRNALGESNVFDRFSSSWTGLEAINPLLAKQRGLPTTRQIACKNWHALSADADVTAISDLVTRHFADEEAPHLRRFRQANPTPTRPPHERRANDPRAT